MLILGIDTATDQVGCAIGGHEGVIASHHVLAPRRHAESLAPAIKFLTEQADVPLDRIGAVAVDVGPGLFTGLRVGFATATAIATALGRPMVGITSLDLLAHAARLTSRLVAAAVDARRGEVFFALYRPVPGGVQQVAPPRVGKPSELASEIQAMGDECVLVGDGATRYASAFGDVDHTVLADASLCHPSAAVLVGLAHAQALREEFVRPWELQPLYLREPDAQRHWEQRP